MKSIITALFVVFLAACASTGESAYWMKKYPDAHIAVQQQCLVVAEAAYEKAGGTQGRGDNGFAVLAKGTAWEKCMDQRGYDGRS